MPDTPLPPLLSVVIPVWNDEHSLGKLEQTAACADLFAEIHDPAEASRERA